MIVRESREDRKDLAKASSDMMGSKLSGIKKKGIKRRRNAEIGCLKVDDGTGGSSEAEVGISKRDSYLTA